MTTSLRLPFRNRPTQPSEATILSLAGQIRDNAAAKGVEIRLGERELVHNQGIGFGRFSIGRQQSIPLFFAVPHAAERRFYPRPRNRADIPKSDEQDPAKLIAAAVKKVFADHGVPVRFTAPVSTPSGNSFCAIPGKGVSERLIRALQEMRDRRKAA